MLNQMKQTFFPVIPILFVTNRLKYYNNRRRNVREREIKNKNREIKNKSFAPFMKNYKEIPN